MEKLRNLGQLGRQHYEKLILTVALLLLAGAVVYLYNESKVQAEIIRKIPTDFEKRPVRPVPSVDLAATTAVLKRAEKPPVYDFAGPHNLFNPVKWQINPGGDGKIIKVVSGDEVGPKAVLLVKIQAVHLIVAYAQTVTSGGGNELVVNGYWMNVTNELMAVPRYRANRLFISLNETNKRESPFILREVKGNPQEPTEFVGEFKDDNEKFKFTPTAPHFRTLGYEANLRFPGSTNTTGFVRKDGSIDIDGSPYKIVDITPTEAVLSDDSNGKLYPIRRFVTP